MYSVEPFSIVIDDSVLEDLRLRLQMTRWPRTHGMPAWSLGTSVPFMQAVRDRWLDEYDWRKNEVRLNGFSHYRVNIESGRRLHYIVEPGSGTGPRPLLLSHGWPGSFVELLHLVEPLAHPERFGGNAEDGFTVVVPSLPGYGFSDPTSQPTTPGAIAADFRRLMVDVLGYKSFLAHGGDWESVITTRLGLDHADAVQAIHVTMAGGTPDMGGPAVTADEQAWIDNDRQWRLHDGAYAMLQASKPQTLSYGLTDSLIGLAAWVLEKFHGWTDRTSETVVPEPLAWDDILTNLMIYWIGGISTDNSLYTSIFKMDGLTVHWDSRGTVPTRLLLFPNDLSGAPPESWGARLYASQTYFLATRGGHFPALEQPLYLADDMRNFFCTIR